MWQRLLLALPILLVQAPTAVAVQVPSLLEVPAGLAEPGKSELKKGLNDLKDRRRKLDALLKSFNAGCASVDKGSSAARQCRTDQGKLITRIKGYSARATAYNNWVKEAQRRQKVQGRMETRDPVWLKSIRNAALQTARSEKKFTRELGKSFRANKPPKPKAIRSFGALKAGEIILVNSEKPGGFVDLVQGFLDRKISRRRNKAPVSHALVYLGTAGSIRLFLDNQLGEGPRIYWGDGVPATLWPSPAIHSPSNDAHRWNGIVQGCPRSRALQRSCDQEGAWFFGHEIRCLRKR